MWSKYIIFIYGNIMKPIIMYDLYMLIKNFKQKKGNLGSRLWEWPFGSGATAWEVT